MPLITDAKDERLTPDTNTYYSETEICLMQSLHAALEVLDDKRQLTRELDIAMHGEEGASEQASLCDLIEPAKHLRSRAETAEAKVALFKERYELEQIRYEGISGANEGLRRDRGHQWFDGYCSGLACHAHGGAKCPGIDLGDGNFSGCTGKSGDCPTCAIVARVEDEEG